MLEQIKKEIERQKQEIQPEVDKWGWPRDRAVLKTLNGLLSFINNLEKKPVHLGGPIYVKGDYTEKDAKAREMLSPDKPQVVVCYDGYSRPDVKKIPQGVEVRYLNNLYVGIMPVEEAKFNTFYLVKVGDVYVEYIVSCPQGNKLWEEFGVIDDIKTDYTFEYTLTGRNTIEQLDMEALAKIGVTYGDKIIVSIKKHA